jgi:hypothetical protein
MPGQYPVKRCSSGSRSRARKALATDAQMQYSAAANTILRNEEFTGPVLKHLLTKIVETSYRYNMPGIGQQGLQTLAAYEADHSESWLPRIEAMVALADWEMFYSKDFGRKMRESAIASYQRAYELSKEHGLPTDKIEALFSPEVPIELPSFLPDSIVAPGSAESATYLDVSFVITDEGEAEDIEILRASPGVERADERSLVQLLKRSRFRPRVVDGRVADSGPLVARHYPGN